MIQYVEYLQGPVNDGYLVGKSELIFQFEPSWYLVHTVRTVLFFPNACGLFSLYLELVAMTAIVAHDRGGETLKMYGRYSHLDGLQHDKWALPPRVVCSPRRPHG
jgi:hypothetical protein